MAAVNTRLSILDNFFTLKKPTTMNGLLYTIAVILVIAWAIGFLGYGTGGIIHILVVIAIVAILLRIISGNKPV
jgi:uncharacterized membrane protein